MNALTLYCNYEINPLGIDTLQPVFAWEICSKETAATQVSYRIMVMEGTRIPENKVKILWVYEEETDSTETVYQGQMLCSEQKYYWQISVRMNNGEIFESNPAMFEMALLDSSCWQARWIGLPDSKRVPDRPPLDEEGNVAPIALEDIPMAPGYRVRRDFCIAKTVRSARAYVTSHGIYELLIDGKRVGNFEMAPEHTYYPNQLFYQIYDITEKLTSGMHTVAVLLADGWYAGRIGFAGDDCQYGNQLGLLLQMSVTYQDGTHEIIGSDSSFLYEQSAYRYADLFVGEYFDAHRYKFDFYLPGYTSDTLLRPMLLEEALDNLRSQPSMHMEVVKELPPISVWQEDESWIIDFGVTLAGKVRTSFVGKEGREVRFLHAEVLDAEGRFIQNIQEPYKNQVDRYRCADDSTVVYEPKFTYHGFRYVKIVGLECREDLVSISALTVTSRMRKTGTFSCSDERINQLQKNIYRSQISNMVSIPTDCPQREKAGWTGDVQVFAPTACFNQDVRNFYQRWLADMRTVQTKDGQIPIIVPYLDGFQRAFEGIFTSAGWSDVAIILPWVMYRTYGDKKILLENYAMMERWIQYIQHTAETENPEELTECAGERARHLQYIWNTGFHFGDWLTPSVSINLETGMVNMMQSALLTMHIVPTLFYFYSVKLMGQISAVLEKKERQRKYETLAGHIREAFQYEYVAADGNLKSELQGIFVMALQFGILKKKGEAQAIRRLIGLIQNNHGKLDTGFLSVPYILDVLYDHGEQGLAYQLLLNEECPSWLYEIKKGATSIWESWQAILPNGICSNLSMNHYACGCVGDWMYRHIAGIQCVEPGYKKIRFAPDLTSPFTCAKGCYNSVNGRICCEWEKQGNTVEMHLEVPVNTTAVVATKDILADTIFITDAGGKNVSVSMMEDGIKLLSGAYRLKASLKEER